MTCNDEDRCFYPVKPVRSDLLGKRRAAHLQEKLSVEFYHVCGLFSLLEFSKVAKVPERFVAMESFLTFSCAGIRQHLPLNLEVEEELG